MPNCWAMLIWPSAWAATGNARAPSRLRAMAKRFFFMDSSCAWRCVGQAIIGGLVREVWWGVGWITFHRSTVMALWWMSRASSTLPLHPPALDGYAFDAGEDQVLHQQADQDHGGQAGEDLVGVQLVAVLED